jgi:hypothetical protein
MKKLYVAIAALLIAGSVTAQSQRIVIAEEFTNASCPPCASQNPAFNALLDANSTKIVSIKYQTNWPGTDPMNAQTNSMVAPRVTYYGVTGVPHAIVDGVPVANDCGAYLGAPACLSQAEIDNRYAVASPFDLALSHSYNSTYDSINITAIITCTQVASGTFVLQTGVIEEEVIFATAPGSNGEKDFYGVMRLMVPSATGTALATSWTVGQTQTINYTVKVPTYIYDKNTLAVVAFIQNNTGKAIAQSALSEPIPLGLDASIKSSTAVTAFSCASTYSPSVELTNLGTTALTTADISYKINTGTPTTYTWNGNLASGASTTVSFPAQTLTTGTNTFTATLLSTNGVADQEVGNNSYAATISANLAAPVAAPVVEGFTTTVFPPLNWTRVNGGSTQTWTRYTIGATGSNGSARYPFYNAPAGDIDELISAKIDLTNAIAPTLNFKIAKAAYAGTFDELEVLVSTDCGVNWTSVFSKVDPALSTVPAQTTAYTVPANTPAAWRAETVSLSAFAGAPEVLVNFRALSDYGNNMYIDDINITGAVGIDENTFTQSVNVYPVPSKGIVFVDLSNVKSTSATISVTDITGKLVNQFDATLSGEPLSIDLSNQQSGTYFVKVKSADQEMIRKIILEK